MKIKYLPGEAIANKYCAYTEAGKTVKPSEAVAPIIAQDLILKPGQRAILSNIAADIPPHE